MDVAFMETGFMELDPDEEVPFGQMKLNLGREG